MIDVAIVGGGPAGLAAALVLGRSRKDVVLFDGGTPRNATAQYIGGFVTQDRVPPAEFRHAAHVELRAYPSVAVHVDTVVTRIERAGARLGVVAGGVGHEARRVLVCTGLVDEPLPLEGSRALWGASLFECPYCHAWEHRDRRFGYLAPSADEAGWVRVLRSWTRDVTLFTGGAFELPVGLRQALTSAGIPVEERRITALVHAGRTLHGVRLEDGVEVPRDVLFFRPTQRQTPVVAALGLAREPDGRVRVDGEFRTSLPGLHAAGDLTSHHHGALVAAAAGSQAAHCINLSLTLELVGEGRL